MIPYSIIDSKNSWHICTKPLIHKLLYDSLLLNVPVSVTIYKENSSSAHLAYCTSKAEIFSM